MTRKSNRKAVPGEKPEQLTWGQINRLADELADDLMGGEPEIVRALILLMHEIAVHSFDQEHVETITILMREHLFRVTPESDRAEKELIAALRARFQKEGGAGR